jgi:hypothetical protein
MRKHLTELSGHAEQKHQSHGEFDKSLHSAAGNALATLAIVLAAVAIAILMSHLPVY